MFLVTFEAMRRQRGKHVINKRLNTETSPLDYLLFATKRLLSVMLSRNQPLKIEERIFVQNNNLLATKQ